VAAFVPNGSTVQISSRGFLVHLGVALITPAPGGRPKVRFELGGGLRWGTDDPDPGEGCTSTPTTGECQVLSDLQPIPGQSEAGWYWDVVAPSAGTYGFRAELVDLQLPDPVPANNASQITIVVTEATGGGSSSGGNTGGTGSTSASASAVKLSPTKPKAGSTVVASVRVTRGGTAVRPTGVSCSGSLGAARLKGSPRAASGIASCAFKTPRSGKGKTLSGAVSFRAGGQAFVKRFSARLG
jgi:hypothetical protein